jgi:hypothetical protein
MSNIEAANNPEATTVGKLIRMAEALLGEVKTVSTDQQILRATVTQELEEFRSIVDTQLWLTSAMSNTLRRFVAQRIRELLPQDKQYKDFSKKFFQLIWDDLKAVFQVPVYREIPRTRYNAAMQYVRDWQPRASDIAKLMEETSYEKAS